MTASFEYKGRSVVMEFWTLRDGWLWQFQIDDEPPVGVQGARCGYQE